MTTARGLEEGARWRSRVRELFAIDPRSLAAFRVALAIVVLVDLALRAVDLGAMYTDDGMFSRTTICRHFSGWSWSFHFGGGSWAFQAGLFALAAAFALALLVGFETRLATVASWLLLVSLHNRVPHVLGGADNLARLLLFWGMFLPLGSTWSLDAWSVRRRGGPTAPVDPVLSVASGAILLQIVCVYVFSALFKSNSDWLSGNAVAAILADGFYGTPLARQLLGLPSLLGVVTIGVVVLEYLGPLLLFCPVRTGCLRLWAMGVLASMHVGVGALLNVGLFSHVAIAGLLLFLPSSFWEGIKERRRPAPVDSGRIQPTRVPPSRPMPRGIAVCASVTCGLAFAYVLFVNLNELPTHLQLWRPVPRVELLTVSLGLGQKWDMFAEVPTKNGWCVARATLVDGTQVDLLRHGAPVDWERPEDPAAIYPTHRWLKCFLGLSYTDVRGYQVFREPVVDYLCRNWNRGRAADKQIADFALVFCTERQPRYGHGPATRRETLIHLSPAPRSEGP